MKRTALAFGAALALLGGCASYGTSGNTYGGGGYYEPDYYGPGQPITAYGGGYGREHRGGDHAWRDADHSQDRTHSDHQSNDQADRRNDYQRHAGRDNNQPAPQNNALGGTHGGMSNGAPVTRGNFWQLDQVQRNAAAPQSGSSQPSTGSGGGHMGRHHDN